MASVALAVPSVYADPASNAVEEPAQTTAAASDVEPLAEGGGDNSWQIVQCDDKDEEGCTTTSADGNVRVHKWVTPTATENVFDVHLSIDKKPDLSDQVLNGDMYIKNNNSGKVGDATKLNGQTVGTGNPVYFLLKIVDENGQPVLDEDGNPVQRIRTLPNIDQGSIDNIVLFKKGVDPYNTNGLCPKSCAKAVRPVAGSVSVGCLHGVTESGHVQVASV